MRAASSGWRATHAPDVSRTLPAAHRARRVARKAAVAERNRPAAFALVARLDGGAGRGALAAARGAYLRERQRDGHAPAQRRDAEWDRQDGLDFVGFLAATALPEDRREQVAEPAERAQVGNVEVPAEIAGRPHAAAAIPRERPVAAQLVVLLPLGGVAQDVVRLADLLEPLGGVGVVRIPVGVVLLGEPAKRLLDFVRGSRLGDAEDLIVVLLRRHWLLAIGHWLLVIWRRRVTLP